MPKRVKKGRPIYFAGRSKFVYLVHSGVVGIFRLWASGEETVTTILGPGSPFGLGAMQHHVHYRDARALSDTVVCRISGSILEALLRADAERAIHFVRLLTDQIHYVGCNLSVPVSQSVRIRLASFFLLLAGRFGEQTARGTRISVSLTHEVIACAVSSTRATVTRELLELRRDGLIIAEGKATIIPDMEVLADLLE